MKYKQIIYIALALILLTGCVKDDKEEVIEYVSVGDPVPAFTITNGTTTYSTAQTRGKTTLIAFFSPVCYDCKRELPKLEFIWDNLQDDPRFELVTLVRDMTLSQLEDAENGSRWLAMPCYPDPDRSTYHLFATVTIPRLYLIDEQGIISKMWVNHISETAEEFLSVIESYFSDN